MNWKLNFTDEVYKTCYICFYQFFGLHQLTKHLRLHISGPYSCLECSKQVPTGISLHEHLRNHFKGLIQDDKIVKHSNTISKKHAFKNMPSSLFKLAAFTKYYPSCAISQKICYKQND